MYKHIVRDKRHSTFNQSGGDEIAQYNMDSMVDISDAASHRFKNADSGLAMTDSEIGLAGTQISTVAACNCFNLLAHMTCWLISHLAGSLHQLLA